MTLEYPTVRVFKRARAKSYFRTNHNTVVLVRSGVMSCSAIALLHQRIACKTVFGTRLILFSPVRKFRRLDAKIKFRYRLNGFHYMTVPRLSSEAIGLGVFLNVP